MSALEDLIAGISYVGGVEPEPALADDDTMATDDAGTWKESDHPRAKNGRFGSGGGGSLTEPKGGGMSGAEPGEGGSLKSSLGMPESLTLSAERAATSGSRSVATGVAPYFSHDQVAHLPKPDDVVSPAETWEDTERLMTEGRSQFKAMLDQVGQRVGLSSELNVPEDLGTEHVNDGKNYVFLVPNKSFERANKKVQNDYGGDWSKLKDAVRATIAVERVDQIRPLLAALEGAGVKFAARPKDNIVNVKPEGYRDLNTLVRLPNGMIAELQVNVKSMVLRKQVAHVFYEEATDLERKYGGPPDATWEPEDTDRWKELMLRQRSVYDPAWAKAGGTLDVH